MLLCNSLTNNLLYLLVNGKLLSNYSKHCLEKQQKNFLKLNKIQRKLFKLNLINNRNTMTNKTLIIKFSLNYVSLNRLCKTSYCVEQSFIYTNLKQSKKKIEQIDL